MKKKKQINIRVSEKDKRQLEKDASGEHRSMSNLLLWCWKQWRKNRKKDI